MSARRWTHRPRAWRLEGDLVVCPWHEWAFHCSTGANDYDPNVKLGLFRVKMEGGEILLDPESYA